MKHLDRAQMLEATRLTQAGRLTEATVLLQRALGGDTGAASPAPNTYSMRSVPLIAGAAIVSEPASALAPIPLARASVSTPLDWKANLPGRLGQRVQPSDIAPSAGRYLSGSYSNAAGSRSYKLYIPSRQDDLPRPLIVMLHGCTQSADDFAAGTRMNFAAEQFGCFVVYPEQPQAANASKCWNWFRAGDQTRDQGEPALIAGITQQITKDHNLDPSRVYVAGLSAGGAAAAIMGEAYPELYAAVGVHSGLACGSAQDLPSAFKAMRGPAMPQSVDGVRAMVPKPTIVFHGDQDSTVHPSNGSQVIMRANGDAKLRAATARKTAKSGHRYSHTVQHDAEGRSILELWELHGADHAWSGGSPAGSFTNPNGPDATQEMLRFFLKHQHK
ncbi:PHB depolymerase family esterase [Hyphomicrobium sp. LHD-15]|uniref:extracellular catalytic domain type 1 short-chain-length polyhydroxyalkanoate depolymerase n=1 Tax=Hyphomicrobium sp. LHD-15 TaxID=3072142 RepID=UPI00280D8011|nr:PHB depolymerase family esterase [Hyphomicrobium sp. LHD-15]MDQ8698154.1 PHB depolymerase family esterase [Hyphomicrobium sp. LHD-15]